MDTQSDRRMSEMSLQANIKTPVRVASTSFVIGPPLTQYCRPIVGTMSARF